MAIQNFFTSRDNKLDGNTYVGELGRLWYNPDTNSIYASDGNTVGGIPVALATGANILANNIIANDVALNSLTSRTGIIPIDGSIDISGSAIISGNISPAAPGKIGGITPGPGVVISEQGELTIDTAGLPLSFGDFTANNNILTIINDNEDMILATSGNSEIQLIGNIGFYKPDGLPPDIGNRYFFANQDGQITFLVPDVDPLAGAVKIIGSSSGNYYPPLNTGVMLHVTGQNNDSSRIYNDSINSFASFVTRRVNGNISSPTPVKNNDVLMRISAVGYGQTAMPQFGSARIAMVASEDYTDTAQGGRIEFYTNPIGSNVLTFIGNVTVEQGITATKFNTSGTISAVGNVNAGNLISGESISGTIVTATGNISGGNIITVGRVTATGNITTSNFFIGNGTFLTGINAFGNIVANGVPVLATSTSSSINVVSGNNISIVGDNGLKNISVAVVNAPSFTGTVTGGNISTAGVISAAGNVTGGNLLTGGLISATGSITSASGITATANVTGGNITTAGIISSTGNITSGNISATNHTGTTFSASGNVISGNVTTSGLVTATGNVTGGNLLTGGLISAAGDIWTASGNLRTGALIANIFNATPTTINIGGSATTINIGAANGNVSVVGNIITGVLVSARNYNGQARDAGTLPGAGTLTIDFATDHMVLANLTTTATIAFSNITAGKTVSVLLKNTTGVNRAVTLGVAAENTSGGNPAPNVNDGRTGVLVYRTFGSSVGNVYCEVN